MINQTRRLLDAAATKKAPREARLNGPLLLLFDRATSRGFWFLPHGTGALAMMCLALFIGTPVFSARAARLGEVRTVDDEIVMVRWLDSEVEWKDTGTGPNAFRGLEGSAGEVIHLFPPPLDTAAAVTVDNYSISSTSDTHYAMPTKPLAAYRKTKVSGTDRAWPNCNCTFEHTIFHANNEFTPQQTMRGKMCLLAYLYSLGQTTVGPRDGESPNDPAAAPSAPAIVSRKGGYASRWTSVAPGDTNITVQLARELETAGPSAALFANPYYVCLRNFYVAPPPGGNDANDGASPQSPWATLTKANFGRVAGDCVNLAPGTYKLTGEATITSGGNASTPAGYVVYRSTRMGAAHLVAAARFNHMIRITTHHVMFDGIEFDGNNFMAGLCGIDVERSLDYHHIWVMNSQVHGFGQSGIQENGSEWFWNLHNHVYSNACTVRINWQGSGISHVVPAAVPNYTPSAMDDYWAPFHIVTAYNLIHDNYGQQGLYAGKNTDGNGIIYDTFRSYAGQSLCLGNITYHNGGKGIHVFKSGHVTVANNTAYNNNWDTCNPGTWRAEVSAVDSVGSTFINNIAWTTRGPGVTAANAPFMAHSGSSNTWANNIAYGAPNDFADANAYPSPANKANVDPLLVDVAKSNFALQPGSPAIGFGTLLPGMPPQCIDVGACPSACTTCP